MIKKPRYKTKLNFLFLLARFVTSRRGKRMIRLNGYNFYLARMIGSKSRWACSTHHRFGCRAAIITVDDMITSLNTDHMHEGRQTTVITSEAPQEFYIIKMEWVLVVVALSLIHNTGREVQA